MIKLLVKWFIKNPDDVKDSKVREKYGVLGGVLGIICNLVLFVIKLVIGLMVNAIAIMSDAFNNLTDSFSSIVSIISAKLSNKKPDKDHPFGHGRIEYIATLIVAFVIILVGFELFTTSGEKLLVGLNLIEGEIEQIATGKSFVISIIILSCSLLVKLWMFFYNRYLGKKINSSVLLASSSDSISDAVTSAGIIIATLLGGLLLKENYFYVDSIVGMVVSIIICINGLKIVLETIKDLLGKPADKEDIENIEKILLSDEHILGLHDLIIHDYGPGRKLASVHAEIDANSDIVKAHEVIDGLEQICYAKTMIELTVHMDPVDTSSSVVKEANEVIGNIVSYYEGISFHDLRITDGEHNINVIFDIVVPHKYKNSELKDIISEIKTKAKELNPKYTLVIKVDRPFVE